MFLLENDYNLWNETKIKDSFKIIPLKMTNFVKIRFSINIVGNKPQSIKSGEKRKKKKASYWHDKESF